MTTETVAAEKGGIFRKGTPHRLFLLSVLVTGVSYGLYKGMLDNYLAEIVGMGRWAAGSRSSSARFPGCCLS